MTKTNSNIEQPKDKVVSLDNLDIYSTLPNNFTADSINFFTEKLKPSAIDWNQTINIEDSINTFYLDELDGFNFVDNSKSLTSQALETENENQNQIQVSDGLLKYVGFVNLFDKTKSERIPLRRPNDVKEINDLLIKETGYTWNQFNNNQIPAEAIESPEFQQGLDNLYKFYQDKGFTINIPERKNVNEFNQILKGLGIEVPGGMALDVVTAPLLAAGPKGILAYGIINFAGGAYLNYKAQELRLGQTGFTGKKDELKLGELFTSGAVQTIPFGVEAKGLKGISRSFLWGGGLGASETTARNLIDEKRIPTFEEYLISIGVGGTFASSMKGGLDLFQNLATKYKGKSASEIDSLLTEKERSSIVKLLDDALILQEELSKGILSKTAKEVHAIGPEFNDLSDKTRRVLEAIESGNFNFSPKGISKQEILEAIQEIGEKYPEKLTPEIKQSLGIDIDTTTKDISQEITESVKIGVEIPRGETAQSGAVFIERIDKSTDLESKIFELSILELQELNTAQLAELGIKKTDIAKLTPRKTINLLKKNFDNIRQDLLPGEYRLEGHSESRRKLFKKWFKDDPDVIWVDRQTGAASTIDDEMSIPYLIIKGTGDGGAIPPKGSTISQGKGPLKGTDTTPHQINPKQVSNTNEQFKLIINRIKQLKTEGKFSQIKTTEDTVEGGIKMLANTNMLKEYARMYAKIYNLVPTDELNYALAEAVTLATQKTSDINQKLINAINVSKDPVAIKKHLDELIASIGEIDEWLRMGIPLRTEQSRGMRSMQIPTKGISPEDFAKLSAAEKYKLNMTGQSNISLDSSVQSLKLQDLKTKILDAFEIAKQTDDYSVLNKLLNTIERASKTDKPIENISALYESDALHKIFSSWNKGNRIFNEIGINALLSAPGTNEINFISGVLETYMSAYELMRGAGSRVELDAAIRHLIALHSNGSFVRKAFIQSFKTSDNYIVRGALKADYKERFVISSDGKEVMSIFIDKSGKVIRFPSQLMTSVDALVQAPNLIAAIHYQGHIEGSKLGLKGEDLTKYIKGHLDAILQYYASNSGKGITDTVTARILKNAQEFAKRSTFTENIRADGYWDFGHIAKLLNSGANQVPLVRTLLSFVRAPTNIIKRQMRRTPGINLTLQELKIDLESVDPLVRNQARGQMKVAKELGFTVAGLTFAGFLMEQNPNFVPPVILTGGGPDWKTIEGRKVWKTMLKNGWQPYSVGYLQKNKDGSPLIGEDGKPVYQYYSYARLDPLSSWIGLMVDFVVVSGVLTDDEYDEFTTGWVGALTRNITDRSYLQQLDDAMKALSDEKGGTSRTNFWKKQFAARTPYANFFRYAKQLPGDILDMLGVPKDLSARFHQKRDTKLRAGDKLFGVFSTSGEDEIPLAGELRALLNEYSETVPGFGGNLPFLRQHITNEPMLYPQRPGLDLFNWVKTSTSKNHPVFSALSIIGKELREPVDIINGSGTDKQIESFRLNTTEYAELRETVNTIKSQKYGGLNLDQALRGYFKTPHYKKNIAIVEERGALNADIAVKEIYSKLQEINNHFIQLGENEWIRNQGTGKIQIQIQKKRNINNEYLNDLNNLSPD